MQVAPSQARGLKPNIINARSGVTSRAFTGAWIETIVIILYPLLILVAPSQARGLKRQAAKYSQHPRRRAFTGAWIETCVAVVAVAALVCRAFTGAWIETLSSSADSLPNLVAPSQARGLKHLVYHS